jgi:hypothetical protein
VLLIIRESVIPINKKHFASSYPISSKASRDKKPKLYGIGRLVEMG